MTELPTIIVRADGSSQIGLGHIMRCIGLSQELKQLGFQIIFAMCQRLPQIESRLSSEGFQISYLECIAGSCEDARLVEQLCREQHANLLIIDGYQFKSEWFDAISSVNIPKMLWTDFPQSKRLPVDIVLDQNPNAENMRYDLTSPNAVLLLGLNFTVLRSEFINCENFRHKRTELKRVLITMGGSDPSQLTIPILQSIQQTDLSLQVDVVVGPANNQLKKVAALAQQMPSTTVYQDLTDMSQLIKDADLAISAAGITLWEFAFSGLPALAYAVAQNQTPNATALENNGGGIQMEYHQTFMKGSLNLTLDTLIKNGKRIEQMSSCMLRWIDGNGRKRVAENLLKIIDN
ncbi:UDP-2,4-diacetamido-2,4,6-trideoxy-beta-L-altropyranose hydrolase [bacterium]|nr:UDP-2,4-diacetamido-2,4,6-trideoxy-beta-L-altropyranose hydrolase [bacterium]